MCMLANITMCRRQDHVRVHTMLSVAVIVLICLCSLVGGERPTIECKDHSFNNSHRTNGTVTVIRCSLVCSQSISICQDKCREFWLLCVSNMTNITTSAPDDDPDTFTKWLKHPLTYGLCTFLTLLLVTIVIVSVTFHRHRRTNTEPRDIEEAPLIAERSGGSEEGRDNQLVSGASISGQHIQAATLRDSNASKGVPRLTFQNEGYTSGETSSWQINNSSAHNNETDTCHSTSINSSATPIEPKGKSNAPKCETVSYSPNHGVLVPPSAPQQHSTSSMPRTITSSVMEQNDGGWCKATLKVLLLFHHDSGSKESVVNVECKVFVVSGDISQHGDAIKRLEDDGYKIAGQCEFLIYNSTQEMIVEIDDVKYAEHHSHEQRRTHLINLNSVRNACMDGTCFFFVTKQDPCPGHFAATVRVIQDGDNRTSSSATISAFRNQPPLLNADTRPSPDCPPSVNQHGHTIQHGDITRPEMTVIVDRIIVSENFLETQSGSLEFRSNRSDNFAPAASTTGERCSSGIHLDIFRLDGQQVDDQQRGSDSDTQVKDIANGADCSSDHDVIV